MSTDIDELLPDSAVNLDIAAKDWRDAICLAGNALKESGFTTDEYTNQMIETVEKNGSVYCYCPRLGFGAFAPVGSSVKKWFELDSFKYAR